ncbi:hypothetical protein GJ744_002786 [Endocarpon pusillum]|uniref:Uncharacterized protein n=1 Tax=Endocarpon pusillum TaxID=364733 RepID=A0A8H7AN03_9EURO|nr:hypothetical protein GJ744_002786 [Endocarpon pusillum]
MSHRVVISLLKPPHRSILPSNDLHELPLQRPSLFRTKLSSPPARHFSSTSSSSSSSTTKPILLEKPERFRPPSHPSRLNARRMPRQYAGPAMPEAEKAAQARRKYPHTFPNEGTGMYWFLTNKYVHLWISLGTLFTLSVITLTQSFLSTSPFAHLTPPIASLATAPLAFIRDWVSVVRMHTQYTTEQTAESRSRNIQDAQKRRLYRRAHGLEDVDQDGVGQGVDVKGLEGGEGGGGEGAAAAAAAEWRAGEEGEETG